MFKNKKLSVFFLYVILISAVYAQVVFFGKSLLPNLYYPSNSALAQYKGRRPINTFNVDLGTPAFYEVPINRAIGDIYLKGKMPLWNPYQGAGTPSAAQYSTRAFFPYQMLENISPAGSWDYFMLARLIIAAFFTYLFLRLLGLSWGSSFLGGIFYSLCGSLTWFINFEEFANVAMMVPICLFALERLLLFKRPRHIAETAVTFAMMLLAGQPEIAIYVMFLAVCYYLFRVIIEKRGRRSFIKASLKFAGVTILALAISAVLILPFVEFVSNAYHSHPLGGNQGIREPTQIRVAIAMLAPSFFDLPTYYRLLPHNGVWDWLGGYTGSLAIYIILMAFFCKGRHRKVFLFFSIFSFFIVLKNFGFPLADWIGRLPLLDQSWSQRWAGPVWTFGLACAAAIGFENISECANRKKAYAWWTMSFLLLVLPFLFYKTGYMPEFKNLEASQLKALLTPILSATAVSLFVIITATYIFSRCRDKKTLVFSVIFLSILELWFAVPRGSAFPWTAFRIIPFLLGIGSIFLLIKNKKGFVIAGVLLSILTFIFIDIKSPYGFPDRENIFKEPEYVEFLKGSGYSRIVAGDGILMPNLASVFGLYDIRYINSLSPLPYQNYVDRHLLKKPHLWFSDRLWFTGLPDTNKPNPRSIYEEIEENFLYYSYLGVEYILAPKGASSNLPLIYDKEIKIYKNPYSFPRVYIVNRIELTSGYRQAQGLMGDKGVDIRTTAILEEGPPAWYNPRDIQPQSTARITEYTPDRVAISADAKSDGILVLTDVFYPGWKAYVDRKQEKIYRVNGLARGVFLKEGSHSIIFRYSPPTFRIGLIITLFSLFISFFFIFRRIKLPPVSSFKRFINPRFFIIVIFVVPFVIFAGSFQNKFLAGDDEEIILHNEYIRSWKYLPQYFTENYKGGAGSMTNFWRPFQLITYRIIMQFAGLNVFPYHIASVLFHSLSGIMLFLVLLKLFKKDIGADNKISFSIIALSILTWLVHPMHNEELSVTTGLANPSSMFWMLLGLFSFIRFEEARKKGWIALSLASFVLALSSKEGAIIYPGLLLGLYITGIASGLFKKPSFKEFINKQMPFWITAFIYIILRLTVLNFGDTLNFYNESNIFTENLSYRIYTLFTLLAHGLRISFFPIGLHPERSWPVFISLFTPQVFISFSLLTALVIFAIILRRKNPVFTFGIFWFFFSYLPTSNIVAKINALVWDHWFYIPSIGIFFGLASLVLYAKGRRKECIEKITLWVFIIAIIIFSVMTFLRNRHWRDTESRARLILKYEPQTAKTWNNLAMALAEKGKYGEAVEDYKRAIGLSDIYPQTHHNLANLYFGMKKYDLAKEEYKRALEMDKGFYYSYLGLGRLYLNMGQRDIAAGYFKKALDIYPYLPDIRKLLNRIADEGDKDTEKL